jgi:ABC-2 type transport system ATP-binding protein
VIAAGTPAELKTRAGDDMIEVHVRDADDLPAVSGALAKIGHDPRVDVAQHRAYVAVDDGSSRLMDALRILDTQGITVEDISLRRPTLDEVFLILTGQPAQTTDPPNSPSVPDPAGKQEASS